MLLEINALTVGFAGARAEVLAVKEVSLAVAAGEVVGIVGESGAGKSSIGAAVADLLEPPGKCLAGEVLLNGAPLPLGDEAKMQRLRGRQIGVIFQDPLTSLDPLFSVVDQLTETLRLRIPAAVARAEAIELLNQVGIPEPEKRANDYPHQFSGGMRQRVVIALALAGEPQLLIADEPTTALDVSVQSQILTLLRRQAAERRLGILLISHDMGVIAQTSDAIAVMKDGEITDFGRTSDILHNPRSQYARRLFAAVPPADRTVRRFSGIGDDERNITNEAALASSWRRAPSAGDLLEIRAVEKSFGSGRLSGGRLTHALRGVSFSLAAGESLGLVGESGSGKTTIARVACGLTPINAGEVRFAGAPVTGVAGAVANGMQMIFQDPYSSLNPRMRIEDIIAEPLRLQKTPKQLRVRKVSELLSLVRMPDDCRRRYPYEFSGGQRQRIAIARALATTPRLLICDEPTSALDVSIQAQILNLLKDLQETCGLSLLFISHDLPVIRQMCDRIGVLRYGELLEIQKTDALFSAPQHEYTRLLLDLMPKF